MAVKISRVETTVVDVGQGQCTFAVLYDDKNKIVHTLLFDCGSDKKSKPETDENIRAIADTLVEMDTPTIDLLVFSHSDNDHISLMSNLLLAFKMAAFLAKKKEELKILHTWYAGDFLNYKKYGTNILEDLFNDKYCTKFSYPDFNATQFNPTLGKWMGSPKWESADRTVQVRMLVGNVVDNKPGNFAKAKKNIFGTSDKDKNGVSIVCALMHDNRSLIICGDATTRSMAWINWYFETAKNPFPQTLMLTLPHHGSRRTGLNVESGHDARAKAIDVVETFVQVARAKTITASAFADFHHPSIELMNYFIPTTLATPLLKDNRVTDKSKSHFAVCNVDLKLTLANQVDVTQENYFTLTSEKNVFTTYYYKPTADFSYQFKPTDLNVGLPPKFKPILHQHACWEYTTHGKGQGGGNTVKGYDKMSGTLFTTEVNPLKSVATTVTDAFVADEDRPSPPLPSLPEPEVVPVGRVSRAPASATRALAASSLGRLRKFR